MTMHRWKQKKNGEQKNLGLTHVLYSETDFLIPSSVSDFGLITNTYWWMSWKQGSNEITNYLLSKTWNTTKGLVGRYYRF